MKERVAKARNEGLFTPPALIDTISMPGNQGGSNWATTAANPQKGLVFVVNVNQVAILRLEDVKTRTVPEAGAAEVLCRRDTSPTSSIAAVAMGPTCRVGRSRRRILVAVTDRMSEDAVKAIVTGGRGLMRPVPGITDDESPRSSRISPARVRIVPAAEAGAVRRPSFSGTCRGARRRTAAAGAATQPRAVLSGDSAAMRAATSIPKTSAVAATRYMSDYGVLASWTKPPYTTITAYDLNTGDIVAGAQRQSPADDRRRRSIEHRRAPVPQRPGRDQGRARVPGRRRWEVPRLRRRHGEGALVRAVRRKRPGRARVA